jgi:hypothetical protein
MLHITWGCYPRECLVSWRLKTACGLASSVFYLAPRRIAGVPFRKSHALIRVSRLPPQRVVGLREAIGGLKIQSMSVNGDVTTATRSLRFLKGRTDRKLRGLLRKKKPYHPT